MGHLPCMLHMERLHNENAVVKGVGCVELFHSDVFLGC